ncbi:protein transport protein SEC16B homolog [Coffea arabica]|uniref:Protein transport protein sec16 n=1 Tax=Coffea arabica TaxID=13443 RepID=A0A6P6U397_COFAR
MASNPPFQVEDQTDEDFFDKLVNDDDDDVDLKVTATSSLASTASGPVFTDGDESDEVKGFANLSPNEADDSDKNDKKMGIDDLGGKLEREPNGVVNEVVEIDAKGAVAVEGVVEESNGVLESSSSFEFAGVVEENNENVGTEVLSDATTSSKSDGSGALGVKEVQWSAFNTKQAQNDSNGFGSYSDFFTELGEKAGDSSANMLNNFDNEIKGISANEKHESAYLDSSNYGDFQDSYNYGTAAHKSIEGQDLNSSQYWENQYPGWKFDPTTGQWYQVDGYNAGVNVQGTADSNPAGDWTAFDGKTEVSYLQNTAQSVAGTVAESGTTESVTNWNQTSYLNDATGAESNWNQVSHVSSTGGTTSEWNQGSQVKNEYPSHMVFDPQYPGWYYDTNAQEWRLLDAYVSSSQSTTGAQDQHKQNVSMTDTLSQYDDQKTFDTYKQNVSMTDTFSQYDNQKTFDTYKQNLNYTSEGFAAQSQDYNWAGSFGHFNHQNSNMWQHGTAVNPESSTGYGHNQQLKNHYGTNVLGNNRVNQQNSSNYGGTIPYHERGSQSQKEFSAVGGSKNFVHAPNFSQQFYQASIEQSEQKHVSDEYFANQNSINFPQQQFNGTHQFSYAPTAGRSSAGRPPHALVTFGFGGKLIVTKGTDSIGGSSYGSQNPVGSSISILNLMELVNEKDGASARGFGVSDYFRSLCQHSISGPLHGGGGGIKELNKWIDERVGISDTSDLDSKKGEALRLLLSLLKIACQHYGKLRSPFGADTLSKENDTPEAAVANLFASAKKLGAQFSNYGAIAHCLQNLPSEGQMRATASEVQSLLVSGRKKEALHCAQEGQLWGPALILAAQLGDQFYAETVKQMALRQLVAGSPLRTLCLLIAGQPAAVFSTDDSAYSSMPGAVNIAQQPAQFAAKGMLDDWEENLAVITANRTKDDELVLIHLGDSLWKEKSDVVAAHICYLVAETSFEPYSEKARLCLVGADHLKYPRTYASPEAIQRTEIYEYSKVLGNSQFILDPFQPYKLAYAHMLAEVGRISDALKYCQAVLKSLKTSRSPEVETLRQLASSLEERIRSYQQGGFSTNLATTKLVGKLLNLFDSTAHRVVGGMPPPVPHAPGGSMQSLEYNQQIGPRVSTSQSTMAISSLIPSGSMEPVSEWASDSNRRTMHNRSVSEPDFGRSPRQDQVDSSKGESSSNGQGETAGGVTSRFSRFGFGSQLLQKTVGLVLRPRQGRQAKLGDTNKFYYDEKLKRWVEEGAEPPPEETALPPPPTAAFQNGTSDYNLKTALKSEGSLGNGSPEFKSPTLDQVPGIPPLPPTSNQFSARARMGVRSRYVDTFNKGGGNQTNLFQSPSISSTRPAASANAKFFVPTPVSSVEDTFDNSSESTQDTTISNEIPSSSAVNDTFHSPAPSSSMNMPRFGSMGSISTKVRSANGSFSAPSRRTASWSGSFEGNSSPPQRAAVKPLGEVLGMPPSSFMPSDSLMHSSASGGSFGDELHEVEL